MAHALLIWHVYCCCLVPLLAFGVLRRQFCLPVTGCQLVVSLAQDMLILQSGANVLSICAAAAAVAIVGCSWGVEKAVGSLGSLALLEGLVDKTLVDLFSQVGVGVCVCGGGGDGDIRCALLSLLLVVVYSPGCFICLAFAVHLLPSVMLLFAFS